MTDFSHYSAKQAIIRRKDASKQHWINMTTKDDLLVKWDLGCLIYNYSSCQTSGVTTASKIPWTHVLLQTCYRPIDHFQTGTLWPDSLALEYGLVRVVCIVATIAIRVMLCLSRLLFTNTSTIMEEKPKHISINVRKPCENAQMNYHFFKGLSGQQIQLHWCCLQCDCLALVSLEITFNIDEWFTHLEDWQ